VQHSSNAYTDQTGRQQAGYVVYETIIVTDTGERYDVDDGYSLHRDHGRIAVSEDGRRFRLHTETVAYSGGLHVRQEDKPEGQAGYWQRPPWLPDGYVYEDGSAPVAYLTTPDEELAKRREKQDNRRRAAKLRRDADLLERA
jgi:hypothetical protein